MPLISPYVHRYEINGPRGTETGPAAPDHDHETADRLPPPGHHEGLKSG